MHNKEKAFRKEFLFNIEDIKSSLKLYKDFIIANVDHNTEASVNSKLQLFEKFYDKVDHCHLPELRELWWYYDYEYTGTGFELWLRQIEEIELNEDGDISIWSSKDEYLLLTVECEYLSVEEFSVIHSVTPVTVRQWIRRGKLRYAKKSGGEWRIPASSDKPDRGFHFVNYHIDKQDPPIIDSFPLVRLSEVVSIHQDLYDKSRFECDFYGVKIRDTLYLNRTEVEELELALISSGKARPGNPTQFKPSLDKNDI